MTGQRRGGICGCKLDVPGAPRGSPAESESGMTRHAFIVSLDYELFFGPETGTPERCLIAPTEALAKTAEQSGFRLTLFVDAGYLVAARREAAEHTVLERHYRLVSTQLAELTARGHDLQLHVHPHWEDCRFDGNGWTLDTSRYRLHDFGAEELSRILAAYREALEDIKQAPVFAYRAGGWCIQPFDAIAESLRSAGVWLDSTVYGGGYSEVEAKAYDFRHAPIQSRPWRFSTDPTVPDAGGWFLEIPISTYRYGPSMFWRMALNRLRKRPETMAFGDGRTMPNNKRYYARRLLSRGTWSPVSIDGVKTASLEAAYANFAARGGEIFNVMGHPKSVTSVGIQHLRRFASKNARRLEARTLADYADLAPGGESALTTSNNSTRTAARR